jgi:hypothetical protein
MLYLLLLGGAVWITSIRCTLFRCRNNSLLSSRLATCGIGCAIVVRKTIASASDSQMPEGCCVTATKVPSNPYDGSRTTLIFLPTFRSSIWKIEGGNSCSGIDKTSGNTILRFQRIKQLPPKSMDTSEAAEAKPLSITVCLCNVYAKTKNAVLCVIEEPVTFGKHALG